MWHARAAGCQPEPVARRVRRPAMVTVDDLRR